MKHFKKIARDLLPPRLQVPLKYYHERRRGLLEPEMALLPDLVSRGDRVIDVGANRGTYAYVLQRLGARVEVFEPNPSCSHILIHWAKKNKAVTVHAVALSDSNGTANLAIPIDTSGVEHDASASIEHGGGTYARLETVPTATLDSFGFYDTKFIKIDVEGHEQSVIAGALATIAASSPAMLIEIEQRHLNKPIEQVFNCIVELGYKGFFLTGGKLTALTEFSTYRHQVHSTMNNPGLYFNNFLFLSKAKLSQGAYQGLDLQ